MAHIVYLNDEFKKIKTPSTIGTVYTLPSYIISGNLWSSAKGTVKITYENGETKIYNAIESAYNYPSTDNKTDNIPFEGNFDVRDGSNIIEYTITIVWDENGATKTIMVQSFTIYGVPNKLPLKPWTNGEVMDRLLQVVEPIRQNQTPRFTWQAPVGKEKVFAELAPEYTFTRLNLRECCQTVGGRIHAEPRLKTINGKDTITFDFYGEQEYATIKNYKTNKIKRLSSYKYTTNKGVFDLEQTCTRLDGYMENLVSRVDWERATIGQPYEGTVGGTTLRTSTEYHYFSESDDYHFLTQYPIDRIVKFEARANESSAWIDITGYLYEKQVYDNLSGYQLYAPGKAFALYYEQGQKDVKGFFYKVPNATGGVGYNYSIVNILAGLGGGLITDYQAMQFRLTYVPIFSTRVGHGKQYINDYLPLPRVINYSQGANQVESRYYGQNIKATAQRLGNIEKSYTFNIRNADNIPKAGQLWDENYYISTVSVECGIDLLRITVGLSKHFNRKSQYIGANSYRRVYEVSETMVQDRNTVYNDYLIVRDGQSETNEFYSEFALLSAEGFESAVVGLFTDNYTQEELAKMEIAGVEFWTSSKNNAPNNYIFLPVVSSAFGNAMEFTFECQDNFSAGIRSDRSQILTTYIFGTGTEYGDYYGRGYYLDFVMLSKAEVDDVWGTEDFTNANDFPLANSVVSGVGMVKTGGTEETAEPYLYRKDSREKTKITYSLEFVADGDDFVLGSGLTSCNPLVSSNGQVPHLYVLPFRVNRFADRLSVSDLSKGVDLGEVTYYRKNNAFFRGYAKLSSANGLSWCIAFLPSTIDAGQVEDEEGNVSTFTREVGGEILIAKNTDIATGDVVGDFEILLVHDLYNDYINKK